MKVDWDYTSLASSYLKRPDYADEAIDEMLSLANVKPGSYVCDIGAGVAHLTLKLAERGLNVLAIEPNDEMRRLGMEKTQKFNSVKWLKGVAENTEQPAFTFDLVTFGSSFNVTNRAEALKESRKILKSTGWLAIMWNFRDLQEKIQAGIESIIKKYIPTYDYGSRREDQTAIIKKNEAFSEVLIIEKQISHMQSVSDTLEAWYSHATLRRQAEDKIDIILDEISQLLTSLDKSTITIPYTTKIWMSQRHA